MPHLRHVSVFVPKVDIYSYSFLLFLTGREAGRARDPRYENPDLGTRLMEFLMGCFRRYFTLDDAEAFLVEAKGLPAVPSANVRMRKCLRACILLSWVALEDGLDSAIDDWGNKRQTFNTLPSQLKQRIIAVLSAVSTHEMDDLEFNRLRKIRNQLTHPKTREDDPKLTVDVA